MPHFEKQFDKIKLQRTPDGKYMIVALDSHLSDPSFWSSGVLSTEETRKHLLEKGLSEGEISKLFSSAENITLAEGTVLEEDLEEG